MKKALIALEDGTVFEGRSFAGEGEIYGELVFNTSMTGYLEILTDPSYHGQIVTLTYPLVGNYGVNEEDVESFQPHAAGLVIGEASRRASNWRSEKSLKQYLEENDILGIDQVDTRAITLHIREEGAMRCVVSTEDLDKDSLVKKAKESQGLIGRDLASEVSHAKSMVWPGSEQNEIRIAVLDCGVKYNQLRLMASRGCRVEVFPSATSAEDIIASDPDGFFISNGPGDPEGVLHVVGEIKKVIDREIPTFGICFGHQLIGLALGGNTFKLKFGHRGANQPVMDLTTGKVEITSQNHGFCVDKDSLNPDDVATTHINLNDGTCEGLQHKKLPLFSVQYHPEACPGPHDAEYLFDRFIGMIKERMPSAV